MSMKEKIKLKIAYKLNDWFPEYFCWAGLVSWAYSDRLLMGLWKEFDSKKGGDGCKRESETHKDKICYCGQWYNGKHCSQKDFTPPVYEESEPIEGIPF
jgi:hypothetical protein